MEVVKNVEQTIWNLPFGTQLCHCSARVQTQVLQVVLAFIDSAPITVIITVITVAFLHAVT